MSGISTMAPELPVMLVSNLDAVTASASERILVVIANKSGKDLLGWGAGPEGQRAKGVCSLHAVACATLRPSNHPYLRSGNT